ncbi:MAG: cupin domain-containing protein [Planctomycetes bacterium]|nr:cupin domain-containing protein [Planctomycetota bacterium]
MRFAAAVAASILATAGCVGPLHVDDEEPRREGPFPSAIVTADQAVVERVPAGALHRYLESASMRAVEDLLVAVAFLNPGEQFHPPHVHAEEELLWIAEGTGVWSLAGVESPAHAGDLLVTEPWVEHGLRNTGTTPLRFFVVKWNPAGRAAPEPPAAAGTKAARVDSGR